MDSLDITGAVIAIDTMGMQTDITRSIIEVEGDYVLALKKNQKALWEDAQEAFTIKPIKTEGYRSDEVDHGRVKTRIYTALSASDVLLDEDVGKWASLQSLLRIERMGYNKATQEEYQIFNTISLISPHRKSSRLPSVSVGIGVSRISYISI